MAGTSTDKPYKVVVFGAGGVGKSCITLRFVTDTFSAEYLPTIEDCYRKSCIVDGRTAFLDILDTAGQEEYSTLRDQWVRDGQAFLLVYNVTTLNSFDEIPAFRDRILLVNEDEVVPMILIGNKIDLEDQRNVSTADGQALADEYGGIPFIECSALTGQNCDEVFHAAVREIRKMEDQRDDEEHSSSRGWCSIL